MVLSTTITVLVFASVVYLLVRAETNESARQGGGEDAGEQVLIAMLLAGPICLVLSVAGVRILSRRSLAPIETVIREASTMTAEDLHQRLAVPPQDDELRDLVVALNALLERLDRGFTALGSYAASASHELRTPVAVITSELEIALRRPRPAEAWEHIARTSLAEMQRLASLIEALLELARAGSSANLSNGRFELREQLDQTLASLDASLQAAHVHLVAPDQGDEVWLRGDPGLLMNSVRELVRNAARHSPTGSTVRVRVESHPAGRVAIHVDDDGPGVAPSERSAIFAPFARGRAGRAGNDAAAATLPGVGLGLAIAKRSVEAWGGTITIDDSPEGGARFTILLPVSDPPG
jgi:signal transduction histidine kinase